jgi:hypothetical protein
MSTLLEAIDQGIFKILTDLGNTIVTIWRAQAPSRTDKLRESIGFQIVGAQGEYTLTFHYLYYGVYVDVGTLKNADKSAWGMTPFELPPWNAQPAKRLGGIVPRYWTSLSDKTDELLGRLDEDMRELFDKSFDEFATEINDKINRLRKQ